MNVRWTSCGRLSIKKALTDADLQAQYGQTWVWAALESATRLVVCYLVGVRGSHLRRKSLTFAKEKPHFEARLAIIVLFYNCIRAHGTLSKNTDKTRTPRTPALVAKLIEKNWTFEEAYKKTLLL